VVAALSVERQVTEGSAPIFIVHSLRDTKVDPGNSVRLHDALVAHHVPTELHLHPDGRHGVGLAEDPKRMPEMSRWPQAFLAWARRLGKLEARTR
jgi:dipeptidyl aminopeptidase/acylaminoacyl peptidase